MKKKYCYLISDGKCISFSFDAPQSFKLVDGYWWKDSIRIRLGEAITTSTDKPWLGIIGVYDLGQENHVVGLAEDIKNHSLFMARHSLESEVYEVFDKKSGSEVGSFMWTLSDDQKKIHKWTTKGKILWKVIQIIRSHYR